MTRLAGLERVSKRDHWPHACPRACAGSHTLTGAHLLASATAGRTLDLDSFSLVGPALYHWASQPHRASFHPTLAAAHTSLLQGLPCPATQAYCSPSFASVPRKNLRGLWGSHSHPTSSPPDDTVLFALCHSELSQTFPYAWALTGKEKIKRPLIPSIYVLNMERC